MSEQKHAQEPWITVGVYPLVDASGRVVALTPENVRRIVACVNACAGLEQSFLEAISQVGGINNTFKAIADYKASHKAMEDELEIAERQRDQFLEALKEARRAIGDHYAPNDCYATGPLTGNTYRDLVECPACSAISMYDSAIAAVEENRKEKTNE